MMNERIRELARRVVGKNKNDVGSISLFNEQIDQFAELIVQECVNSIPLDMEHIEYLRVMRAVKNTFRSQ
jgi:hypothetical protein